LSLRHLTLVTFAFNAILHRLVALTDDSKATVAAAIVKGAKLSVAGSAADAI
jgi:hypothetical protein